MFFKLKLKLLFDFILSYINKNFKFDLNQGFYLYLIFILILVKINLFTKKKRY